MCICTHFLAAAAVAVLLLLLSAATTTTADPSDELCLTNLHGSLTNTQNLQNWTKTTFATPCQGSTSYLQGATCNNNRIFKLTLPNLSLSGTISPYLSNCTNLQTLDLSSNSLTGPIPVELQFLVNLAVLNLSLNSLNGEIPQQLTLCAYLNVIDLHGNRLTGAIPMQLGLLVRLNVLDLSGNRLEGMIPGNLRFNSSSYLGNKGLYGGPLGERKSKGGVSVMAIVGIGLASGFASLAVSFAAVCVWLRVTEERLREEEVGKHSGGVMPEY